MGVTLLPGVDRDAHFQEGPKVDTWRDRAGCHWSHFGLYQGPCPPHPQRSESQGGVPGAHVPIRKAKPASIPSLFCSVSRLCGVAVSQIISPREPRPVRRLNWGGREAGGDLALPHQGGASTGAARRAPKPPHLEEVGHHVDVGARGRHEHAESEAGIDLLQVLLGGGRAAGEGAAGEVGAAPPPKPPHETQAQLLTCGRT